MNTGKNTGCGLGGAGLQCWIFIFCWDCLTKPSVSMKLKSRQLC